MPPTSPENGFTLILGATHGLGLEIAKICRARRWPTIEVGKSIDREEFMSRSRNLVECNLRLQRSVDTLIHVYLPLFAAQFPELPIVQFFWVANPYRPKPFDEQASDEVLRMVDENFTSPVRIAHALWQRMLQNPDATCTFTVIASASSANRYEYETVFSATKNAQVDFVRGVGLEAKKRLDVAGHLPVKVHLVVPEPPQNGVVPNTTQGKIATLVLARLDAQATAYQETHLAQVSL